MKNIRVVENIVQEIFVPHGGFELADCFTPEVVAMFETAPDNVEQGWIKHADGSFTAPVIPSIPVVTPE
jgi:hypothetical protein